MSDLQIVTAGDLKGYIAKLAKLSKEALQTRIANIKRKQKLVSKMLDSGKFTSASKPGPKTVAQAKYALRGLVNALQWHEEALSMQGKVATASVAVADEGGEGTQFKPTQKGLDAVLKFAYSKEASSNTAAAKLRSCLLKAVLADSACLSAVVSVAHGLGHID